MAYLGIGPNKSALVSNGTVSSFSTTPSMGGPFSCIGLTNTGFLGVNYLSVTTGVDPNPYLVGANGFYISVDATSGAFGVTLPNVPPIFQIFIIKDRVGIAGTHNITVTSQFGSALFDGSSSAVINSNFGSMRVLFNGTNYELF